MPKKLVAKGDRVVRLAPSILPEASADSRVVRFVFSDGSVDRYGDTIDARGWNLTNYKTNPVALFGHDAGSVENVIGKTIKLVVEGDKLVGDIEFMAGEINPNAEAVYQMVRAGYLNAVSVGFMPTEWKQANDKSRPGGIDFKKQELMEISIVPCPANPNAIALARAAGIDVDRLALTRVAPAVTKKGLYSVSFLASILTDLGYLSESVAYEAEYEGDGSEVPAMLQDALKKLGAALIAMTVEEVAELLGDEEVDVVMMSAGQKALKDFALCARMAATKAEPMDAFKALVESSVAVMRAGRVLSAENEKCLRDVHGLMTQCCDLVLGVVGQNTPAETETNIEVPDDLALKAAQEAEAAKVKARETRVRRARAAKAAAALVA